MANEIQGPTKAELASENAELRGKLEASEARENQVLDYLAELKATVDRLEAAQVAPVAVDEKAAAAAKLEAELDAELAQLRNEFKDYPAIDIFEQYAVHGSEAASDIRLIDEPSVLQDPGGAARKWHCHWFNFAIEGRASKAAGKGYIKVKWDELQEAESIATLDRRDEFVRIGEHGKEVLHKMPLKLYEYRKRRAAAQAQGLLSSEAGMRDHLAHNVARMAGNAGDNADQAGSLIHGKGFQVSITKGATERVTL